MTNNPQPAGNKVDLTAGPKKLGRHRQAGPGRGQLNLCESPAVLQPGRD
jgi:hypothetical protein